MRSRQLRPYPERAVTAAEGRILEVGDRLGSESSLLFAGGPRDRASRALVANGGDGPKKGKQGRESGDLRRRLGGSNPARERERGHGGHHLDPLQHPPRRYGPRGDAARPEPGWLPPL